MKAGEYIAGSVIAAGARHCARRVTAHALLEALPLQIGPFGAGACGAGWQRVLPVMGMGCGPKTAEGRNAAAAAGAVRLPPRQPATSHAGDAGHLFQFRPPPLAVSPVQDMEFCGGEAWQQ